MERAPKQPWTWTSLLATAAAAVALALATASGTTPVRAAEGAGDTAVVAPPGPPRPPKPAIIAKCETCHGVDGASLHFDFPKLTGQRRDYLLKQMRDIKAGRRKVDVMVPVLSLLEDKDMQEIATYFSSLPLVQGTSPDPAAAKVGKKIFDLGVPYRMVAQCSACHGTYAEGRVDPGLVQNGFGGFPALNGQHAAYTIKQLKAFRSGERSNDFNQMMHNLAANMSDQEITMVANYVAGMELPPPPSAKVSDAVAVQAPAVAANCVGCHGPSGNSISPVFPKLAGQQKAYMLKQLQDIQSGARKVPMMEKIIEPLKPEDFEVIATYFAAQTPSVTPSPADDEVVARGMKIFFEGTDGVLACYTCHNFDGRGTEDFGLSPGGYPMLFGQHASYLAKQLRDFRSSTRKNDYIQTMHNIARNMSDEEITAVTEFLQDMQY